MICRDREQLCMEQLGSGKSETKHSDIVFLTEVDGRLGDSAGADWQSCNVRSKPKSSPEALRASTTPSDRKVRQLAGSRVNWPSSYSEAPSMPSGRPAMTGSSAPARYG